MECIASYTYIQQWARMTLAQRVGANIKAARKAKSPAWSLERLAAKIKPATSYQHLSRLEKGSDALTLEWVERIALALGVDPIELIAPDLPATPQVLHLDERVAIEAARTLAAAALGEEPSMGTVQSVALVLRRLVALFSSHPEASTDLRVARPAIALAGNRLVPEVH